MSNWTKKSRWGQCNDNKINLTDNNGDAKIMSIKVTGNSVRFREECDGCFSIDMTIKEAKQTLKDALSFIDKMENKQ